MMPKGDLRDRKKEDNDEKRTYLVLKRVEKGFKLVGKDYNYNPTEVVRDSKDKIDYNSGDFYIVSVKKLNKAEDYL